MTVRKNRLILTVLLFFLFLLPVRAETGVYTNSETGYTVYMMDQIDLLSDEEEAKLIEDMKPITAYGNVAFISARAYGDDTGSYAKDVYRRLMGTQSGMIFVIDMQNRNIWIHSNGRVYQTITRAYANTITDNIYRYATRGEYYECAKQAYEQAFTLLEGGRIAQPMKYITNALFALITAVLLNYLLAAWSRRREKAQEPEVFGAITAGIAAGLTGKKMIVRRKHYSPRSSGSSGGSSGGGGGGGSSGGGGGGGHSF